MEARFSAGGQDVLVQASEGVIRISGLNGQEVLYGAAGQEGLGQVMAAVVAATGLQGAEKVGVDLSSGEIVVTGKFGADFITILLKVLPLAIPLVLAVISDIKNGKTFLEAFLAHLPEIINIIMALLVPTK